MITSVMNNTKNTPEIRFKGFNDEWEQRKLSDIYGTIRNGFVGTASPYYVTEGHFYLESNNVKNGSINKNSQVFINDEFYYRQKDKWLHTGDLVMVQSGHVGHSAVIPENLNNTAAHALIMFQNQKTATDPYFLNAEFQTNGARKQIEDITKGNTIKHILASDMKNFRVILPSLPEQHLIAEYFYDLDNLITLHQREYSKLQSLKKSMLENCFPKNGKKVPKVRFSGFTGDWEQRKVSDVADRYDNLRIPVAANLRKVGSTPYYGANGIQDYVDGFTHDGEFILVAEDGANDLKNYPVNYVNGRIWVNNHAHVLQGRNLEADTRFLGYAISQADIESVLVGGGRAKLNADVLMNIDLLVPDLAEQQQIGTFFSNLDSLITLHQCQLSQLQRIKKSMLQKMFA